MLRYEVKRPFVDFGMYHGIGEIISDASIITSLEVKTWDGTLQIVEDVEVKRKKGNKEPILEAVREEIPALPIEEALINQLEEPPTTVTETVQKSQPTKPSKSTKIATTPTK